MKSWLTRKPVVLVAIPVAVFLQTLTFRFVWDDEVNVARNPHVNAATLSGLKEIWQKPHDGLYIPVTYTVWAALAPVARTSEARDATDLNPTAYHLLNLALHILNGLLVFMLLRRIVANEWAAAGGAVLFLIHPVQVEAVAWVTGMKDLLAGFFSLVGLVEYLSYAEARKTLRVSAGNGKAHMHYGAATLFFVAAMLAKPAAVVLPILALLLDRYVVRRSFKEIALAVGVWLLLAVPFVIVTRIAQPESELGFVPPLIARPLIAADAVAFYVDKLVLPFHLAADYGRTPEAVIANGWIYVTWLVPAVIGGIVWRKRKNAPLLLLGALFSVAALLPVLGIVPFRFQNSSTVADRYLYLAFIGVAVAFGSMIARFHSRVLALTCVMVLASLAIVSGFQARHWRNDTALFGHVLTVNPRSWAAHYGLGRVLVREGNVAGAIDQFREAVRIQPDFTKAHYSLAGLLLRQDDVQSSIREYRETLRIAPGSADAHYGLARALDIHGDHNDALAEYNLAVEAAPGRSDIAYEFGRALAEGGDTANAVGELRRALKIDPEFVEAQRALDRLIAERRLTSRRDVP